MPTPPSEKQSIIQKLAQGHNQFLYTSYLADLETPVSAYLKLTSKQGSHWSFLLESVEGGEVSGRYSFIGFAPDLVWKCENGLAFLNKQPLVDPGAFVQDGATPFDSLDKLRRQSLLSLPPSLPPQVASLVGYIGYDMIRLAEKLAPAKPDVHGMPDSLLMRPSLIAVVDNVKNQLSLIAPIYASTKETEQSGEKLYTKAHTILNQALRHLESGIPPQSASCLDVPIFADDFCKQGKSNLTPEAYKKMVKRAKQYIIEGDIFQVVLSQRYDFPFPLSGFNLYRSLRRINPSPFLFHLQLDDCSIIGSSPEILVRLRDNKVTIRPIAGTRKRGETPQEDQALSQSLLNDPKEVAEHLMLLDLGRNDVGRVATGGTVRVTQSMGIEFYSHVIHMTSNVEGDVTEDTGPITALMAGFPAGTVTGAPKIRAMEIIDELEKDKRGIYAGCIGYFGADGSMDTCIALRTAIVKDGVLSIQAGAGIVNDSVPASEHQECKNKAQAIVSAAIDALELAAPSNSRGTFD